MRRWAAAYMPLCSVLSSRIFTLMISTMFLAMVIVVGIGSIMGSIAGAILLSWLDLQLRNILNIPYLGHWLESLSRGYFSITGVSNCQCIVFGMIMILIMLFEPLGLCGSVDLLLVPGRLPGVCRGVVHQAQWIVCPPPRQESLIEAMYA